jgi:hypothetical protein
MSQRLPKLALVALLVLACFGASACKTDPKDVVIAVESLDPEHGGVAGEQPVTIHGDFRTDIGYTVYFGTTRADHVSVRDEHELVAIAPHVNGPGKVDVVVIADTGPGFRMKEAFLYQEAGGNIMEHVGAGAGTPGQQGGNSNLAY